MLKELPQPVIEKLSKKLVDTLSFLKELEEQKKAALAAFREQIGTAKKRISSLAEALDTKDLTRLLEVLSSDEIESLTGQKLELDSPDDELLNDPPF